MLLKARPNFQVSELWGTPLPPARAPLPPAKERAPFPFKKLQSRLNQAIASEVSRQSKDGRVYESESTSNRSGGYSPMNQRYRPFSFDEIVGQNLPTNILRNSVIKGRIRPAYLFSGPRGTGKTSAARILAAALNCSRKKGNGAEPCGCCSECRAIKSGASIDVREVDAASNSGVEAMRSLLETVRYAPVSGKYKVYIIDECHMLSSEAEHALLKTLEEPPSSVVFILVTTDPQRLLQTVKSRCEPFKFQRISDKCIAQKIKDLANKEQIRIEESAVELLAQLAEGSLRDATSMLDQLSLVGDVITPGILQDLMGVVSESEMVMLLRDVMSPNQEAVVRERVEKLLDFGAEPTAILSQLVSLVINLLTDVSRVKPSFSSIMSSEEQTARSSLIELTRYGEGKDMLRTALCAFAEAEKQIRANPNPQLWLKVALFQLPLLLKPNASLVHFNTMHGTNHLPSQNLAIQGIQNLPPISLSTPLSVTTVPGNHEITNEDAPVNILSHNVDVPNSAVQVAILESSKALSESDIPSPEFSKMLGETSEGENLMENEKGAENQQPDIIVQSKNKPLDDSQPSVTIEKDDSGIFNIDYCDDEIALQQVLDEAVSKTKKRVCRELLRSKGKLVCISGHQVYLEFCENWIDKASSDWYVKFYRTAFKSLIGHNVNLNFNVHGKFKANKDVNANASIASDTTTKTVNLNPNSPTFEPIHSSSYDVKLESAKKPMRLRSNENVASQISKKADHVSEQADDQSDDSNNNNNNNSSTKAEKASLDLDSYPSVGSLNSDSDKQHSVRVESFHDNYVAVNLNEFPSFFKPQSSEVQGSLQPQHVCSAQPRAPSLLKNPGFHASINHASLNVETAANNFASAFNGSVYRM